MTLLLDSRAGSYQLAKYEPVRSLLPACPACAGTGNHPTATSRSPAPCRGTGRQLSLITPASSPSSGGPDALICGQGPTGPLLVAVEIKELRELIQAADTGRLQAEPDGQLPVMLANYSQSWLLWYGVVRCGESGYLEEPRRNGSGHTIWRPFTHNGDAEGRPLKCSFLHGLLFAVARMGVLVGHVSNTREAAQWLGDLHASWTKPWDDHTFTRTFRSAPRFPLHIDGVSERERRRARRVFDRYTGLGMERSLAAAKYFGSVQEMANATPEEWERVPGIGPGIAAHVTKEFRD